MANLFMCALGRTQVQQRQLIDQLERARQALADQAVAEERRRIARELHDLAGHTLAAVLLHVTGARHVLRRGDLDEADAALVDAETVGRASLDQIRATVASLRTEERGTDPSLAGVADLPALVEDYRRAGLTIDASIDAARQPGSNGPVGTAVHRVAREGLANVARHAPGNHVTLSVDVSGDVVRLVVADRGRPASPPDPDSSQFGLVGMAERARALGGQFEAGPTADGWRVEADCRCRRDPHDHRRRPARRARRRRPHPRTRRRLRRRRRVRRRRRGPRSRRRAPARPGADGHPHAPRRRRDGDPRAGSGAGPATRARADDVRRRRRAVGRARRRRRRVRAQGRLGGRTDRGEPGGGQRRRLARPEGRAASARARSARTCGRDSPRRHASTPSPSASTTCCG